MAAKTTARRRKNNDAVSSSITNNNDDKYSKNNKSKGSTTTASSNKQRRGKMETRQTSLQQVEELRLLHLPPILLVFTILVCSGCLWILHFRDVMATGRPIDTLVKFNLGDDTLLDFTKSRDFFIVRSDGNYWKSSGGGLSGIKHISTDQNNMGGLFVRKVGGVAGMTFHMQKLIPLVFAQSDSTHYGCGHYTPLLLATAIGNVAIAILHYLYLDDLQTFEDGSAATIVTCQMILLLLEAFILVVYALKGYKSGKAWLQKQKQQSEETTKSSTSTKLPNSFVSNIVTRTVVLITSVVTVIAGRDFFFPGYILSPFPPYDDLYLEWTNAFLHSPPPNSPEYDENGFESAFYVGDKYVAQHAALALLLGCFMKFVSTLMIRNQTHGVGLQQVKPIWQIQCIGDALLTFMLRLFAPAAKTVHIDFRYHLMCMAYETFILGLYGYF